jgi:hypothetical protein
MATPRVSFRSPPTERRRLLRAAESLGTTPSNLCRLAVRELLNMLVKEQLIPTPPSALPESNYALRLRKDAP